MRGLVDAAAIPRWIALPQPGRRKSCVIMTAAGQFAEADVSEELMVTLMRRGRIDADSIGVDDGDVEGAKQSQGRVGGIIEGDVRKFGMRHADHHQAQGSAGVIN